MGLPKATGAPARWFKLLQSSVAAHTAAITLLQETHATETDVVSLKRAYRATWGFNRHAPPMSYWSSQDERKGGVAILLNPYVIKQSQPALEDLWSPFFIAVTCQIQDVHVLVANMYAPTTPADREKLFRRLAGRLPSHDGPVVVGGDFNCTNFPELDRSYRANAASHVSPALAAWVAAWKLEDALTPFFPPDDCSTEEMHDFHAAQHTYSYTVGDNRETCRLDRWYVSADLHQWTNSVNAIDLGGPSDHSAVILQLLDPTSRAATRPRAKLYPPKACAASVTDEISRRCIEQLAATYQSLQDHSAPDSAFIDAWDDFKARTAAELKAGAATAIRTVNNSYKTRVARLRRRMRRPQMEPAEHRARHAQLQATVAQWQALKRRRQLRLQSTTGPAATRAFYARAALPRAAALIPALQSTPGAPPRAYTDVANRMADGWEGVFTQPPRLDPPPAYATPAGPRLDPASAASLDAPISRSEIELSLKRCQRTKSAGPDQLSNAWYRDYASEIIPVLHTLFTCCYRAGSLPPSFQTAMIVCLPKAGQTTDPLGYRPIALLNTDYKVFMRVLAHRLKPTLPKLISDSQAGFVPGRSIHDTIDLLQGAQLHATRHRLDTIAVLLDIRKAYDSLDRTYLARCLEARGLPPAFRTAVAAAHNGTTGRFRVNGSLSRPVTMTRGIRQGCPVAPLLFILAMDPLYRQLTDDTQLRHPLGPTVAAFPVCAGYADDTAIYVRDTTALLHAERQLEDFATASGLQVNKNKSIAVRLSPHAQPIPTDSGFTQLQDGTTCRYLGVQVGRRVAQQAVWTLTKTQIRRRLAMASVKTHSVRQRATLARSIVLPKILFVARHHWPSRSWVATLDTCIRNFVWSAQFTDHIEPGMRGKHWMTQPLACLPQGAGGLGLPDIELELHTMAAMAVARWGYAATRMGAVVATLHEQDADYIQPQLFLTTTGPRPRLSLDMWTTGRRCLEWTHSSTIELPLQILMQDSIRALQVSHLWRWWRGEYERDYSTFHRIAGNEITRSRGPAAGRLSPTWIPNIGITKTKSAILWVDGTLLTTRHLAALGTGRRVADFVEWHWVAPYTIRFRPKAAFPLSNDAATTFRLLCDTLVVNFPDILRRPDDEDVLHTYNIPPTADVAWRWESADTIRCYEASVPGRLIRVSTQHHLQRLPPVAINGTPVVPVFECTPRLTKLVQVWRGSKPWRPQRRRYKRALEACHKRRGMDARDARDERWRASHPTIVEELAQIEWHELTRQQGLTSHDQQLWLRIRHHQLHSWPGATSAPGCPRAGCPHDATPTTGHILWDCPAAQSLWTRLAEAWGAPAISQQALRHAIFARTPPDSQYEWRSLLPGRATTISDHLSQWLDRAWLLLVTSACHRLWRRCIDDTTRPEEADYHAVMQDWALRVRSSIGTTQAATASDRRLDTMIARLLLRIASKAEPPPTTQAGQPTYLLFFDGGSRGNPGPGGSGAVIVRVAEVPSIVWAASMSYAATDTTNNLAEYRGLACGLAAAERHGWTPIEVIGDSKMIIQQMQARRRPKKDRLQPLYETARSAADVLNVRRWHHHYRAHNKMADKAANQAMDTATSYQTEAHLGRPELAELLPWLHNDVQQWAAAQPEPPQTRHGTQQRRPRGGDLPAHRPPG